MKYWIGTLVLLTLCWWTSASVADIGLRPPHSQPELVPTPGGLVPKQCVYKIKSGSKVQLSSDESELHVFSPETGELVQVISECQAQTQPSRASSRSRVATPTNKYDGWTAYTAYNLAGSGESFSSFLGDFTVADMPAEDPEILYIFTGLQNIDWIPVVDPAPQGDFDIIQPVLQYPGDEGQYWSVKSWYVTLRFGALQSDEVRCDVGTQVFGNMTRTGTDAWYIGSTCNGQTTEINHASKRLRLQPWAYTTIECYGCDGCSTYPTKPCVFSQMSLQSDAGKTIEPSWLVNPKPSANTQCHELPTVKDSAQVIYTFQ